MKPNVHIAAALPTSRFKRDADYCVPMNGARRVDARPEGFNTLD